MSTMDRTVHTPNMKIVIDVPISQSVGSLGSWPLPHDWQSTVLGPGGRGRGVLRRADALRVGKADSTAALDGGARQECVRKRTGLHGESAVIGCVEEHRNLLGRRIAETSADVGVQVRGDRDLAMSEPVGDHLYLHPGLQRQAEWCGAGRAAGWRAGLTAGLRLEVAGVALRLRRRGRPRG